MSEFSVLSELLPTPARYLVLVPNLVLVPGPVLLQRRLVPEMRVCAGLSGPLVLSLVLVLVRGWEADLELLDLVEEVSQNFYEFLHLDKVSPSPWQPGTGATSRSVRGSAASCLGKPNPNRTRTGSWRFRRFSLALLAGSPGSGLSSGE